MKLYVLAALIAAPLVFGNETDTPPPDGNVNSRYKVESVELAKPIDKRISRGLRDKIDGLVGSNFDPQLVSDLATRIRKEVHVVVSHRVERGLQPEHVKVVYEAKERRWDEKDAEVTKLAYHQKQGWTAESRAQGNSTVTPPGVRRVEPRGSHRTLVACQAGRESA